MYVCAALENILFYRFNCQLMFFIILIFRLALLMDWYKLSLVTKGYFAYFLASRLVNSFFLIPAWPRIYCTVSLLLVWSQSLARSLNCLKVFWLELLRILPALPATSKLSKQIYISETTLAIKLFNTYLKPSSIAIIFALYTLLIFFKEIPYFW